MIPGSFRCALPICCNLVIKLLKLAKRCCFTLLAQACPTVVYINFITEVCVISVGSSL